MRPSNVDVELGYVERYPCGVQRPCHVDVGLCSEPAGPAHLLRQGAPVHLRWLQVARVQNLFWEEVSLNL